MTSQEIEWRKEVLGDSGRQVDEKLNAAEDDDVEEWFRQMNARFEEDDKE